MRTNGKNFTRIVEGVENKALLGGGATIRHDLEAALALAPHLFCADGGANLALEWGYTPEKVIGDLDSVDRQKMVAAGVEMVHVADQDSTDFEKCLQVLTAPVIIGVGFLGARLDHQLAALSALTKHPEQPVILIDSLDICFLCPPELALSLPVGTRFSLFPITPCQAGSTGLRWPLDGLALEPTGRIATSNETSTPDLSIHLHSGQAICILPKQHLAAVANYFSQTTASAP